MTPTLADYAEVARDDDWSLRSALVRVAQRDPELASRVLDAVRRCDAALAPHRRALESHGTTTDRPLTVDPDGGPNGDGPDGDRASPLPDGASQPATDTRTADLARLLRSVRDEHRRGDDSGSEGDRAPWIDAIDPLVAGYREVTDLDDDEVAALPLLVAALDLDDLAALAAGWAVTAPDPLPADGLDRIRQRAWATLDDVGAPREEGRPPPGARSRRG